MAFQIRESIRTECRPRCGGDRFRQVLELLHPARRLDDIQDLGHPLEAAHRLDGLSDLLDLLQRDRAAIGRGLLDGCRSNYYRAAAAATGSFSAVLVLLSLPLIAAT